MIRYMYTVQSARIATNTAAQKRTKNFVETEERKKQMQNKKTLAQLIIQQTGLTNAQAQEMFDTITQAMIDELLAGGKVIIKGLGTFTVVDAAPRMARNVRKGEPVLVPAHKRVKFKASPLIKDGLNK